MNIILISRAGRRHQFDSSRLRVLCPALAVCLVVATLVFVAGYFSARHVLATRSLERINAWQQQIAAEQQSVEVAKAHVQTNIAALSAHVGELKANIIRLNALGRQLIEVAGLEADEFNFQSPPAEGGPMMSNGGTPVDASGLTTRLTRASRSIRGLGHQLSALENYFMRRNLQTEMHPSGWPIEDGWISSYFGRRVDPITGRASFHPGIDFAAEMGTPVHAVAAGIVTWAGSWYGYGNLVEIDNGHGYATRYGHNRKILVEVGEAVAKGEVIALMGSTGHSTGPHVHLEVLYHGQEVNPLKFVRSGD